MAGILLRAIDNNFLDPDEDRKGGAKRGMPIDILSDEQCQKWINGEWPKMQMPYFALVYTPGVDKSTVKKYLEEQILNDELYRYRKWIVRWDSLPQAAKDKLSTDGYLTIKAGSYSGSYDYTWTQVKSYFRNQETGFDEVFEL